MGSRITNSGSMLESAYLEGGLLGSFCRFLRFSAHFVNFRAPFFLVWAIFHFRNTSYKRRDGEHVL
jgi:hypothetical protein